jgi:hypothetical protein
LQRRNDVQIEKSAGAEKWFGQEMDTKSSDQKDKRDYRAVKGETTHKVIGERWRF